jgi:hypothetical protein
MSADPTTLSRSYLAGLGDKVNAAPIEELSSVAAERAAIVRVIQAEAESCRAKARDIWVSDARPTLEGMRQAAELRAACGALLRIAVVISQRETEGCQ